MRYLPLIFWHPDIIQGTCKLCKNICLRKHFFAAIWCDNFISPSRSCNIESEKWQVDEEEHKFSNPKPKFCKPSCNIIVYDDSISPRTTCSTAGEKWIIAGEAKVGWGPHGCRASSTKLFIEPGNEWCTWDMLAICRLARGSQTNIKFTHCIIDSSSDVQVHHFLQFYTWCTNGWHTNIFERKLWWIIRHFESCTSPLFPTVYCLNSSIHKKFFHF